MAIVNRFRCPDEDYNSLLRIMNSGDSEKDTLAPLLRLFIKMGLLLYDQEIRTIQDLEACLRRASSNETRQIEDHLIERLAPYIEECIERALQRRQTSKSKPKPKPKK